MSIQNLLNSTPVKLANANETAMLGSNMENSETLVNGEKQQSNAFMQLLDSLLGNKTQGENTTLSTGVTETLNTQDILGQGLIQSEGSMEGGKPLSIGIVEQDSSESPKDISNSKLLGKLLMAGKSGELSAVKQGDQIPSETILDNLKIGSSQAKDSLAKTLSGDLKLQESATKQLVTDPMLQLPEQGSKQLIQKQELLKKINGKNSYQSNNMATDNLIKLDHSKIKADQPTLENSLSSFNKSETADSSKLFGSDQVDTNTVDTKMTAGQFLGVKSSAPVTSSVNNQNVVHLSSFDNVSSQELINKITTYIEQSSFAKTDQLNLTVHHKQLGQFDVAVNNNQQTQALDILINSATKEGNHFFQTHEKQLVMKLQQAGFELNDLKIVSRVAQLDSSRNSGESSFNNSESQNGKSSSQSQHQSQQNADSQRRKNLWEEYRERYYA